MEKKDVVYDADKLARFFGVTRKTIHGWCRRGKLPGFKIGKHWKVRPSDLQKMIDRKISTLRKSGPPAAQALF